MSDRANNHIVIDSVDIKSPNIFWDLIENAGLMNEKEYYDRCFDRQVAGDLTLYIAKDMSRDLTNDMGSISPGNQCGVKDAKYKENKGKGVGFCILNWCPKYAYFRKANLPEIQDLNVLREYRRQGIGRAIISHCENIVRKKGIGEVGIGVGLDSSFGAAQRLYIKMGYIPDGSGVSYDRIQVAKGEFRPIDENLCLMMTKNLV